MMSSFEQTLKILNAQLEEAENNKLFYEDELAYANQAPYGNSSDTIEAAKDYTALLEDVTDEIDYIKESINELKEVNEG